MGLESATFIPELVDTNPIGASDPVSQGDNHIRLVKGTLLNSFPGFVGTTGTPKAVSKTEDEINDLAEKSAAQTISGAWTWSVDLLLADTVWLKGDGLDLISAQGGSIDIGDRTASFMIFEASAGDCFINHDTVAIGQFVSRADGSILVRDSGGVSRRVGFRDPDTFVLAAGAVDLLQSYEGQIVENANASRAITVPSLLKATTMTLSSRAVAGTTLVPDGGVTMEWANGSGSYSTGTRNIAGASVVQLQWRSTTNVLIWGNGIS